MININPENYYTQRNNRINPMSACMPTSRVMFYKGNDIPYLKDIDMADDDYFMWILNTDEAKEYARKKYPWSIGEYPPNEIHGMYSTYLDNIVCGGKVSDFKTDLTFDEYIYRIKSGEVIMTSGSFPRLPGHSVVFAGIEDDNFLICDPWGDFRNNYKSHKGYSIPMSYEKWLAIIKPVGESKKWGHIKL